MAEGQGVEAEGAAVAVSIEVTHAPSRPASTPDAPLPRTGWDAGALTVIGLTLVLLGSILVLLVRTQLERIPTHA